MTAQQQEAERQQLLWVGLVSLVMLVAVPTTPKDFTAASFNQSYPSAQPKMTCTLPAHPALMELLQQIQVG
jgi:hypothetical protein